MFFCCQSEDTSQTQVVQEIGDADERAPVAILQEESAVTEEPVKSDAKPLKVKLVAAWDVRTPNSVTNGDPYASVEIKNKPESKTSSPPSSDKQCPQWDFEAVMVNYREGEDLDLSVCEREGSASSVLGRVTLPSAAFHPHGFCGYVPLQLTSGADHKSYFKVAVTAQGGQVYPPGAACSAEFSISVERENGSLGLDLDMSDGMMARVCQVKSGYVVDKHNKKVHPSRQVREGDFICSVNGAIGNASSIVQQLTNESKLTLDCRRAHDFTAEIEKKGKSVGLELSYENDSLRSLLVKRVVDGPVKEWNQKLSDPQARVRTHDRLIAVNGKKGTSGELLDGIKASDKASFTFSRAAPTPSDGPVDVSMLPRMSRDDLGLYPQPAVAKYKTALVQICVRNQQFGGSDKSSNGHRYDSVCFANGLIAAGMSCQLLHYVHEEHELFFETLRRFDAIIVRCNPGHIAADGGDQGKFDEGLRELRRQGIQVWPSPDVMEQMGAKDALVKVAKLSIGLEDTFAYYSAQELADGFRKTLAFQPRVIKQNRGSAGEGIWVVKLKRGNYCDQLGKRSCADSEVLDLTEANDNHSEEHTVAEFLEFCVNGRTASSGIWISRGVGKYLEGGAGAGGLIVDQRFCPRIQEGELRYNMIGDTLVGIIHKKPKEGGISAVGGTGSVYTYYGPDEPQFKGLTDRFVTQDLPEVMPLLGLSGEPLPLWWTTDFINSSPAGTPPEQEKWIVGEFNCSCVGVSKCLPAYCKADAPKACYYDIPPEDLAEARRYGELMGQKALAILLGRK